MNYDQTTGSAAFIDTVFTPEAAALLLGQTGLHRFDYPAHPVPGDLVTLRTSPGNEVLTFVCKARRFDFATAGQCSLQIVLDVSS